MGSLVGMRAEGVSALRPDELVEPRDAGAASHRHVARVVPGVLDTEPRQAAAEEAPDVVANLGEVVARVSLAVDAVEDAAAVGMDETADERLGMLNDFGGRDPLVGQGEDVADAFACVHRM